MPNQQKESQIPSRISDFLVLPVEVPTTISSWSPCRHHIFIRRHRAQFTPTIGADPSINNRSLYAVNIPIDSTVSHFRALFSKLSGARVEDVIFEDESVPMALRAGYQQKQQQLQLQKSSSKKRKREANAPSTAAASTDFLEGIEFPKLWDRTMHECGSSAVIVFVDSRGLETTLKALKSNNTATATTSIKWGDGIGEGNKIPSLGSARYMRHQQLIYPDVDELIANIDKAVAAYDAQQAAMEELQRRMANEPDEDGFVTVVSGPKARVATAAETAESEKAQSAAQNKQKGVYSDFYRFQLRDAKKQNMKDLVSKFEGDRQKLKDFKEKRGFRHR